mgnify:CR=1 FL=1
MNLPDENDAIEKMLREEIYISDACVTARVLKNLPRRRHHARLRRVILLGAAGIGAALAAFWVPWENLPPLIFSISLSQDWQALSAWLPVFAVTAALTVSVVAAFQPED